MTILKNSASPISLNLRNSILLLILVTLSSIQGAFLLSNHFKSRSLQTIFLVEFETKATGNWQLFYDVGNGFNETDSKRIYSSESGTQTLLFRLPAKRTYALRLDPADVGNYEINIHSAVFKHLSFLSLSKDIKNQFKPLNGVESASNGMLTIQGNDPQILLDLEKQPYELAIERMEKVGKISFSLSFIVLLLLSYSLIKTYETWFSTFKKIYLQSYKTILLCAAGSVIACYFAFLNGYPLLYSDSGMHILSGFEWFIPTERTVIYGWFIRLCGFEKFPLLPLLFQSAISVYVILSFTRKLITNQRAAKTGTLIIVNILILFSSYGWFSGQLLPDFFCAISPLILLIYVLDNEKTISRTGLLWLLFLVTNLSHTSTMLVSILFSGSIFLLFLLVRKVELAKRSFLALAVAGASFPILMSINFSVSGKAELLKNQPLFLSARFIHTQCLQEQLKHQKYDTFELKKNLDDIVPDNDHFLWNENSIKNRISDDILLRELKTINRDILLNPHHIVRFFIYSIKQTGQLMRLSNYGHEAYQDAFVNKVINKVCSHHTPIVKSSKQYNNQLNEHFNTDLNKWITRSSLVFIGIASLILILMKSKTFPYWIFGPLYLVFINDLVCGFLSALHSRYHLRTSWLCFLSAIFLLTYILSKLFKQKQISSAVDV